VRDNSATSSDAVALRTVIGRRSIVTSGGSMLPSVSGQAKFSPRMTRRSCSESTVTLVITSCGSCAATVVATSTRPANAISER
jgi:hypothetical protein